MKLKLQITLLTVLAVFMSCSEDSATEEFNQANQNASVKLITNLSVVSAQDASENQSVTINYNGNNQVANITDGVETSILVYDNDNLTNVTGEGETLNVEELYESPYDAFETGEVLQYDSNMNPVSIRFLEEEFDFVANTMSVVEYFAEIEYDATPNPFFYTLEAAGIIDVLDNVDLNFSMDVQAPEIVQARLLLPTNNIKKITYKDEDLTPIYQIVANYVYDAQNYPSTGTVTSTDLEDDSVSVYTTTFTYME
ncbi:MULTISPECIES: hypothetical protein [unclassified Olleya]|jgi:hypothetical protein|uniref:hypothetical protein n=1 Tax=unclassified Olleya TaxID=2615019 RepID=UPI0011A30EC1|nr:hypothetical protein [Olleya sp. Hel_I_94]TVZ48004.1 hypothetical protein JM82_2635 [Olleya sp. Hel_I_94]